MKKSFNFVLMGLLIFALVSLTTSCNKDDGQDEEETGVASFIGSYDFTVTTTTHEWSNQLQQCETFTETETHLITINKTYSNGTLAANQLVIRNLVKNSSDEVVIDITDNSFVITESNYGFFTGTGTKSGNSISIQYEGGAFSCNDADTGSGTAVKK